MPSKLDFLRGLFVLLGFSLVLNALGKLATYGLSSGSTDFPLVAIILGFVGVIVAIGVEIRYRYLKEKQKYDTVNELELLHEVQRTSDKNKVK